MGRNEDNEGVATYGWIRKKKGMETKRVRKASWRSFSKDSKRSYGMKKGGKKKAIPYWQETGACERNMCTGSAWLIKYRFLTLSVSQLGPILIRLTWVMSIYKS